MLNNDDPGSFHSSVVHCVMNDRNFCLCSIFPRATKLRQVVTTGTQTDPYTYSKVAIGVKERRVL